MFIRIKRKFIMACGQHVLNTKTKEGTNVIGSFSNGAMEIMKSTMFSDPRMKTQIVDAYLSSPSTKVLSEFINDFHFIDPNLDNFFPSVTENIDCAVVFCDKGVGTDDLQKQIDKNNSLAKQAFDAKMLPYLSQLKLDIIESFGDNTRLFKLSFDGDFDGFTESAKIAIMKQFMANLNVESGEILTGTTHKKDSPIINTTSPKAEKTRKERPLKNPLKMRNQKPDLSVKPDKQKWDNYFKRILKGYDDYTWNDDEESTEDTVYDDNKIVVLSHPVDAETFKGLISYAVRSQLSNETPYSFETPDLTPDGKASVFLFTVDLTKTDSDDIGHRWYGNENSDNDTYKGFKWKLFNGNHPKTSKGKFIAGLNDRTDEDVKLRIFAGRYKQNGM